MYLAPEVIQGKNYGLSSDLYSLGVVLYEMIMGAVPFDATNIDDLLHQIVKVGPRFHGQKLSKKLETLILSLLEADPLMRVTHSALFEIVLKDPTFPNNFIEKELHLPQTKRTLGSAPETGALESFVKEILYERSKYTYLIDLAAKATYFKKYPQLTKFKRSQRNSHAATGKESLPVPIESKGDPLNWQNVGGLQRSAQDPHVSSLQITRV